MESRRADVDLVRRALFDTQRRGGPDSSGATGGAAGDMGGYGGAPSGTPSSTSRKRAKRSMARAVAQPRRQKLYPGPSTSLHDDMGVAPPRARLALAEARRRAAMEGDADTGDLDASLLLDGEATSSARLSPSTPLFTPGRAASPPRSPLRQPEGEAVAPPPLPDDDRDVQPKASTSSGDGVFPEASGDTTLPDDVPVGGFGAASEPYAILSSLSKSKPHHFRKEVAQAAKPGSTHSRQGEKSPARRRRRPPGSQRGAASGKRAVSPVRFPALLGKDTLTDKELDNPLARSATPSLSGTAGSVSRTRKAASARGSPATVPNLGTSLSMDHLVLNDEAGSAGAALHRGGLHPSLQSTVKQGKALQAQIASQFAKWETSRQREATKGKVRKAKQEEIMSKIQSERKAVDRSLLKIELKPTTSEHAERLLKTRIERNFRKSVNRWIQDNLGWGMANWKNYVQMGRDYDAWCERVDPYVRCIQVIYRNYRGRMIAKAAREYARFVRRTRNATHIQRVTRGMFGRRRFMQVWEERQRLRQLAAAEDFQRIARGHLGRKRLRNMLRRMVKMQLESMGRGNIFRIRNAFEVVERLEDEEYVPVEGEDNVVRVPISPAEKELLEDAFLVIEEIGVKGLGSHKANDLIEIIDALEALQERRTAMQRALVEDAEFERITREEMLAEETAQRNMERVLATRKAKEEAEEAERLAKIAREEAEEELNRRRREAVEEAKREAERQRKLDAERELARREKLEAKRKKAEEDLAALKRKKEDAARKRLAKKLAEEEKAAEKEAKMKESKNRKEVSKAERYKLRREAQKKREARAAKKKAQQIQLQKMKIRRAKRREQELIEREKRKIEEAAAQERLRERLRAMG